MSALIRCMATAAGVCAILSGLEAYGEGPAPILDSPREASTPIVYRTIVQRVAVRRIEYVDTAEGKKPVVKLAYEDRKVSVPDEESVVQMREELKRLRQLEVDQMDPVELVSALKAERSRGQEREAWNELQNLRKQLMELSAKFPQTEAARIAISAGQIVPESVVPSSPPGSGSPGVGPVPLPTY